jgi:hypothetical protein
MNTEINNNQGEKPAAPDPENKDRLAVRAMIVILVAIIAYAGYEYFWLNLKRSELVNQNTINTPGTTTPKKEVSGDKIEAEQQATTTQEVVKKNSEPLKSIEAKNSGPAMLKITEPGRTFTIGLIIVSDCQTLASGDSVETARKTARLTGLTINGIPSPVKFDQELVCIYPAGIKEAYVPDPRLAVTSIDRAGKKIFFSVSTSENQGSGRETVWRNNFFFDLTTGTIK